MTTADTSWLQDEGPNDPGVDAVNGEILAESPLPIGSLKLVTDDGPRIDVVRAQRAVAELLASFGADLTDESLASTPARVARAYAELLQPRPFALTTFPNEVGYDELVLTRDIPFQSLCEHHLMPFMGVVIEAEHQCMSLRGVKAQGSRTVTSALHGLIRHDARTRSEFLALAGRQ